MFIVPGAIALVVEPLLLLLADRHPRRWFVRGGLAAMAAGVLVAAAAPNALTFALALSIVWTASGVATSIGEAMLVDRFADERGRILARWGLWSLAGDLAAPALLAVLAYVGLGWRVALIVVAALLLAWLVGLLVVRESDHVEQARTHDAGPQQTIVAALRDALRDRTLVAWLFGRTLCDLLDEILVVFATVRLRIDMGVGPFWQGVAIASFMIGGAVGLVAAERLLRHRAERWVLTTSALACAVSFAAWLTASTPLGATLLFALVGATAAPLYPLASAQAYARRPQQSATVLAAGHLFTPLGLALPFFVGAMADHAGITVALALLVTQPLGLVVLVAATRPGRST